MNEEQCESLIRELIKAAMALPVESWRRARWAVSPEEFAALQGYCLKRDGRSFGRIRDVPLRVENDPLQPPLEAVL